MKSNISAKISILFKAIKVLTNWYLYPLVYYGLIKNEHVVFQTKSGLKIKIRTNSTDIMAFTHVWLIEEYSTPGFDLHESDTIIDIGAHIGLFTLFASQFCKNGKIYCFEPVKENYDMLSSNISLNRLSNVFAFNMAVTDKTSPVRIYLNSDESGHSMFEQNSTPIEAQSTTLAHILDKNNISSCDFVKMDCEGAEYDIIGTLSQEYFSKIKKMIIEYHMADNKPELLQGLISKLKSFSFDIKQKILFADIGFLYVKAKS
jgi:FkbM family methyltransferase